MIWTGAEEVWCYWQDDGLWQGSLVIAGVSVISRPPVLGIDVAGDPVVYAADNGYGRGRLWHLDRTAPTPDPPSWLSVPHQVSDSQIAMEAAPAADYCVVEYFFDEMSGNSGGNDSGWQADPTYVDGGLLAETEYCYQIKVRDQSVNQNETAWSTAECAMIVDSDAPSPDPAEWEQIPYVPVEGTASMEAVVATDPGGVEYYFEETTGNPGGDDSGWQDSSFYTDTSLTPGTDYCYRVQYRDKSTAQNAGEWSQQICLSDDAAPPSPSPSTWCTLGLIEDDAITMLACTEDDPSGVEYYFEEITDNPGGNDSGWQSDTRYTDTGLDDGMEYCYRVRTRDLSLVRNESEWSTPGCATTTDFTPPPTPSWAEPPHATGDTTVSMTAALVSDPNGADVEYLFEETSGGDSGWGGESLIVSRLDPNTSYSFRVKARDTSVNANESEWSEIREATTAETPMPSGEAAPAIAWIGIISFDVPEIPASSSGWILRDVTTDALGNIYAVGEYWWDDPTLAWHGCLAAAKWSPAGELLWQEVYIDDFYVHPQAATTDAVGNLYVTGIRWPPGGKGFNWFIATLSSEGEMVDYCYVNDTTGTRSIATYSIDIDVDGLPIVGAYGGSYDIVVRKAHLDDCTAEWYMQLDLPNITTREKIAKSALIPGQYVFVAKNYPTGDTPNREDSYYGSWNSMDPVGDLQGIEITIDLADEEQPMALATSLDGEFVSAVWHVGSNAFTLQKLNGEDLNLLWSWTFEFTETYVFPRAVTVASDGNIYVVGRVSGLPEWQQNSDDSYMFVLCCDSDERELWRDIYDYVDPSEAHYAVAEGVACSPDGAVVYMGGAVLREGKQVFYVVAYGEAATGTAAVFRVESATGAVHADGTIHAPAFESGAADVAEWVHMSTPAEPGDVVEFNPLAPQRYRITQSPFSSLVAGVISTTPGVTLGTDLDASEKALLALVGIVPVKVTDEGGPIQPGDLLVTSSTPGHAMRWAGPEPCSCSLVGKALEPMDGEQGVIMMLLTAH